MMNSVRVYTWSLVEPNLSLHFTKNKLVGPGDLLEMGLSFEKVLTALDGRIRHNKRVKNRMLHLALDYAIMGLQPFCDYKPIYPVVYSAIEAKRQSIDWLGIRSQGELDLLYRGVEEMRDTIIENGTWNAPYGLSQALDDLLFALCKTGAGLSTWWIAKSVAVQLNKIEKIWLEDILDRMKTRLITQFSAEPQPHLVFRRKIK